MAETKRVEVTLVGIRNISNADGLGDELEIYGELYANTHVAIPDGELRSSVLMWTASSDKPEDIGEDTLLQINNTQIVTVRDDEQLGLGGRLTDYDWPDEDDYMGNKSAWVKYGDIYQDPAHYQVAFKNGEQKVLVEYIVNEL